MIIRTRSRIFLLRHKTRTIPRNVTCLGEPSPASLTLSSRAPMHCQQARGPGSSSHIPNVCDHISGPLIDEEHSLRTTRLTQETVTALRRDSRRYHKVKYERLKNARSMSKHLRCIKRIDAPSSSRPQIHIHKPKELRPLWSSAAPPPPDTPIRSMSDRDIAKQGKKLFQKTRYPTPCCQTCDSKRK